MRFWKRSLGSPKGLRYARYMAALKGCATHVCVLTDQPFDEKHRWIELRVGLSETRLVLFMFDEQGMKPGTAFNGALACDNVEKTYQEMVERGVEFVAEPTKQPWGTFAIFKDPDDNTFVLSSR
jgi:glyoxalase/bleomycin resistance protein/dioxygenase superfamily protein